MKKSLKPVGSNMREVVRPKTSKNERQQKDEATRMVLTNLLYFPHLKIIGTFPYQLTFAILLWYEQQPVILGRSKCPKIHVSTFYASISSHFISSLPILCQKKSARQFVLRRDPILDGRWPRFQPICGIPLNQCMAPPALRNNKKSFGVWV